MSFEGWQEIIPFPGGGQQTILGMIAAEELGVGLDDVTVIIGDTQDTPYGPSCHASRCTPEMGPECGRPGRSNVGTRREIGILLRPIPTPKCCARDGRTPFMNTPWAPLPP